MWTVVMVVETLVVVLYHDDVIKWKHFPRYRPFVRRIHLSPLNSPHKGEWRGALMFSLICDWTYGWVNNRDAGDLRRHRAHYDVIVMYHVCVGRPQDQWSSQTEYEIFAKITHREWLNMKIVANIITQSEWLNREKIKLSRFMFNIGISIQRWNWGEKGFKTLKGYMSLPTVSEAVLPCCLKAPSD